MKNTIYKGRDNDVVFKFTFSGDFAELGLNNFSRISVEIGGELYDTDGAEVSIKSATELSLNCGMATQLTAGTSYKPEIVGYNITYDDGYVLSKSGASGLAPVIVLE